MVTPLQITQDDDYNDDDSDDDANNSYHPLQTYYESGTEVFALHTISH